MIKQKKNYWYKIAANTAPAIAFGCGVTTAVSEVQCKESYETGAA